MRVLVTGGIGYIGSHTLIELIANNYETLTIDNLSNSYSSNIKNVEKIIGSKLNFLKIDLNNKRDLNNAFKKFLPDAVIHFSGLKSVEESVKFPEKYYYNNVEGTLNLINAMSIHGCKTIIFSSSATVYGNPISTPIKEDHPLNPLNPYGKSKKIIEDMLNEWSSEENTVCSLRYFNPIGSHESGIIGDNPKDDPKNIVPKIFKVLSGDENILKIFGKDYNTSDGTGKRDYIHISDLANAHLCALENISEFSAFKAYNVGTSKGTTVLELIKIFESVSNRSIPYEFFDRRKGDVEISVASSNKIREEIKWESKFSIYEAVESSWAWFLKNSSK